MRGCPGTWNNIKQNAIIVSTTTEATHVHQVDSTAPVPAVHRPHAVAFRPHTCTQIEQARVLTLTTQLHKRTYIIHYNSYRTRTVKQGHRLSAKPTATGAPPHCRTCGAPAITSVPRPRGFVPWCLRPWWCRRAPLCVRPHNLQDQLHRMPMVDCRMPTRVWSNTRAACYQHSGARADNVERGPVANRPGLWRH